MNQNPKAIRLWAMSMQKRPFQQHFNWRRVLSISSPGAREENDLRINGIRKTLVITGCSASLTPFPPLTGLLTKPLESSFTKGFGAFDNILEVLHAFIASITSITNLETLDIAIYVFSNRISYVHSGGEGGVFLRMLDLIGFTTRDLRGD